MSIQSITSTNDPQDEELSTKIGKGGSSDQLISARFRVKFRLKNGLRPLGRNPVSPEVSAKSLESRRKS